MAGAATSCVFGEGPPAATARRIDWLSTRGYWPEDMPRSARRADLGFGTPRPSGPAGNSGGTSGHRNGASKPGPQVILNGRPVSAHPDDLAALAREVAADLTLEQLATSATSAVAVAPRVSRARGSSSDARARGGSYQAPATDPDRTLAVGVAGEVTVAVWLREQFGVEPEDAWESSLRIHGVAGGRPGDDRLGYDFLIHDGNATYLYEVKASIGDSGEFVLGESEVRCASRLKPGETYFIVYVSHVLDRGRRTITLLPNPFGAPDLAGFELVSTQLRLRFNPATEASGAGRSEA